MANSVDLTTIIFEMKKAEYPESIEETQELINELSSLAESEPDRERRRELFLLKIELRDHIIQLGIKNQRRKRKNTNRVG